MNHICKSSFAVHPGGSINVRFGRVKTAMEQGLSLFPDMEMFTCPVHSLALAVVVDIVPSERLFRQLPRGVFSAADDGDEDELSLLDLLQERAESALSSSSAPVKSGTKRAPGVHAYVNRLLKVLFEKFPRNAGLTPGFSSHSFRRDGAQAANTNAKISLQWIFDRGWWRMSSVNKAFVYIFNTTNEDQQVAKVLSGWNPSEPTWIPTLRPFDDAVLPSVRAFCSVALHLDTTPDVPEFKFHYALTKFLGAVVIHHYPTKSKLQPHGPYCHAIDAALEKVGLTENELVSWALVLRTHAHTRRLRRTTRQSARSAQSSRP